MKHNLLTIELKMYLNIFGSFISIKMKSNLKKNWWIIFEQYLKFTDKGDLK